MQKSEKIIVCDVCGKKVTDDGTGLCGGHPFSGWYHLQESGGSTMLHELQRKKDWDICSKKCLKELFSEEQVKKDEDQILAKMVDAFKLLFDADVNIKRKL